jgi:large subunit ribosomal protein L4
LNKTWNVWQENLLSQLKQKRSNIIVLEDFNFETQNTKNFINVLKALELENKSLFVLGDTDKNVYLSSRNLKASSVVSSLELSTILF